MISLLRILVTYLYFRFYLLCQTTMRSPEGITLSSYYKTTPLTQRTISSQNTYTTKENLTERYVRNFHFDLYFLLSQAKDLVVWNTLLVHLLNCCREFLYLVDNLYILLRSPVYRGRTRILESPSMNPVVEPVLEDPEW